MMVDLQTVIEELNKGKIEFDYKDDDCCTTEGEVVILLKRLAELEKADVVKVVRCKDCAMSRETEDERYLFCMRFADTVDSEAFCSYGGKEE